MIGPYKQQISWLATEEPATLVIYRDNEPPNQINGCDWAEWKSVWTEIKLRFVWISGCKVKMHSCELCQISELQRFHVFMKLMKSGRCCRIRVIISERMQETRETSKLHQLAKHIITVKHCQHISNLKMHRFLQM